MQLYKLPDTLDDDIKKYEELVQQYLADNISKIQLKSYRVPMGVYEQRNEEKYMMRIRTPAGTFTPAILKQILKLAQKYTDRSLHFTTRQEIQVHNLNLIDTVKLMKALQKIGLASRGGGGNSVRNIVGSYDSGTNPEEVFDITPYAQALTTRLIAESDSWTLPRKYKIGFSSHRSDTGLATVTDLGFIAKKSSGQKGFSVYVAGGMGAFSAVGKLLFDFVPDTEVYNIAKTVKNLFDKYGNRRNKHRARLRFLYEKLGENEFQKRFFEEYQKVKELQLPPLKTNQAQKYTKYKIQIPLLLGDLPIKSGLQLTSILEKYKGIIIKITPTQNLLITNIENDAKYDELKHILTDKGYISGNQSLISNAVSCAGARTCKLGICYSQNLLKAFYKKLTNDVTTHPKTKDLYIKVSGCPNTCGHHIISDIGFYGAGKRYHNRMLPYYNIVLGGRTLENKTQLAKRSGGLPAKVIPDFLNDFLQHITTNRYGYETFHDYLQRIGLKTAEKIIDKYSEVPDFDTDNSYYYDLFTEDPFNILEKVEGECSAGLFDLIDFEFSVADKLSSGIETGTSDDDQQNLRKIVVAISRSLLITKGLEAKTDSEAVELFQKYFIGTHIDKQYTDVADKYRSNEFLDKNNVFELLKLMKQLYDEMDNSLKLPVLNTDTVDNKTTADPVTEKHFKDLRGVACPMNFVITKLALEKVPDGEVLKVLLDDGEPINNVPGSVRAEGHKILSQKQFDNYWSILIKKRK